MHMKGGFCRKCQHSDTDTLKAQLNAIRVHTEMVCNQQRNEYGGNGLPDKTIERLQQFQACKTIEEAQQLSKKTIERNQIHFLAAWANGKIRGRVTVLSLERAAKEADGLVAFLTKKGLNDQAESQRQRAAKIRDEIDAFKKGNT